MAALGCIWRWLLPAPWKAPPKRDSLVSSGIASPAPGVPASAMKTAFELNTAAESCLTVKQPRSLGSCICRAAPPHSTRNLPGPRLVPVRGWVPGGLGSGDGGPVSRGSLTQDITLGKGFSCCIGPALAAMGPVRPHGSALPWHKAWRSARLCSSMCGLWSPWWLQAADP